MKIKPLYIYGTLAVAAIIFLIFFTSRDNGESAITDQMPQDEIHKQMENETPPGKGNVSNEFYQQLEMLRKDVEENPADTAKLMRYADYLTAAHQFDSAIPVYEEILAKNPKRTDVYFALTFIYYNRKEFTRAEEVTNKVLGYDKNNLQAKYNLGAIAAAEGDKEKARTLWTKLLDENPGSREADLAKNGLAGLE